MRASVSEAEVGRDSRTEQSEERTKSKVSPKADESCSRNRRQVKNKWSHRIVTSRRSRLPRAVLLRLALCLLARQVLLVARFEERDVILGLFPGGSVILEHNNLREASQLQSLNVSSDSFKPTLGLFGSVETAGDVIRRSADDVSGPGVEWRAVEVGAR